MASRETSSQETTSWKTPGANRFEVQSGEGPVLTGFEGARHIAVRTPLFFWPASVLYIPGVSHIGRWVYHLLFGDAAPAVSPTVQGGVS